MLLVGVLYGAYELSRGLDRSDVQRALANGRAVLSWERSWHIAPERSLNNLLDHCTPLAVLAAYIYSTLHYLVTPAVLVWLYRRHPDDYRSARTTLAWGTLLGLVIFLLVPTAPPRLVPGSGIHDTLATVSRFGWWSGEGSAPRGLGGLTNQMAAMPSLHVGWALWAGVLVVRHAGKWWVRSAGALYPVVIVIVVLSTGNHYLVDAIAGAAVMVLGAATAAAVRAFWVRKSPITGDAR